VRQVIVKMGREMEEERVEGEQVEGEMGVIDDERVRMTDEADALSSSSVILAPGHHDPIHLKFQSTRLSLTDDIRRHPPLISIIPSSISVSFGYLATYLV
jgi:hypothetical protein